MNIDNMPQTTITKRSIFETLFYKMSKPTNSVPVRISTILKALRPRENSKDPTKPSLSRYGGSKSFYERDKLNILYFKISLWE